MELTQATLRPRKLFIPRFISTTPQVATTRTRDLSASDVCLFVQSSGLNASQDRTDRWSKSGAVEKPFWRIRLSLTSVCASQDRRRAAFNLWATSHDSAATIWSRLKQPPPMLHSTAVLTSEGDWFPCSEQTSTSGLHQWFSDGSTHTPWRRQSYSNGFTNFFRDDI